MLILTCAIYMIGIFAAVYGICIEDVDYWGARPYKRLGGLIVLFSLIYVLLYKY